MFYNLLFPDLKPFRTAVRRGLFRNLRQPSCRVRPLAVGTITKKTGETCLFCYGAAGRGRTDTVSLPRDFESRASANSTTAAFFDRRRFLSTFFA